MNILFTILDKIMDSESICKNIELRISILQQECGANQAERKVRPITSIPMKNSSRLTSLVGLVLLTAGLLIPAHAGNYAPQALVKIPATDQQTRSDNRVNTVAYNSSSTSTDTSSLAQGGYGTNTNPLEGNSTANCSMKQEWLWEANNDDFVADPPKSFYARYLGNFSGHLEANVGTGKQAGSHVLAEVKFDLDAEDGQQAAPYDVVDPEAGPVAKNIPPTPFSIAKKPAQGEEEPNFPSAFAGVMSKTLTSKASVESHIWINSAYTGFHFTALSGSNRLELEKFEVVKAVSDDTGVIIVNPRNPRTP